MTLPLYASAAQILILALNLALMTKVILLDTAPKPRKSGEMQLVNRRIADLVKGQI